ncbi:MAG: PP2C family protein-serine/threonine phosphatase [Balneolaceae bacterium]|nr:PP2C family protein-serine/threonine phosphatase [Balneolaceae bacterium]MCH8547690.1 PP2C family protein-serine/threonine phosphatase [Balneolaceae bacterium]
MSRSFPNKETPLLKELAIWFLIATGLAVINWFIFYRPYPEDPNSSMKLLFVHLAYSYFVFLHILILIAIFRTLFLERLKPASRLIQEASGLTFAFIGFAIGVFNMQWFADYAHSYMFPDHSINFNVSDTLIYWLGVFVAIGIIGLFAVSYYTMRLNLKASYRIHLDRERLQGELDTARKMQMGIMPSEAPEMPGVDIAGICLPATEVGGDYFDYFQKNGSDSELGFTVADVSGKGMSAAMTAVMVSGMLHAEAARGLKTAEMLNRINGPLFKKTDRRMFTALLFGILNMKQMQFTFTNAGQSPPLLLRDGAITVLKAKGPRLPVGITKQVDYTNESTPLKPGDRLLIYTDGVNEAMNQNRKQFGDPRLMNAFSETADIQSAEEALASIQSKVNDFTGSEAQHDDITMVYVKIG